MNAESPLVPLVVACTRFTYTKDQVQSLATTFKINNFNIESALSWGLEVFKTEDVDQILCIAGLLDKIKSVAEGNPITDKDVTGWIQEALDKTK